MDKGGDRLKAIFVHDHKFIIDEKDNFYSYGKLTSQSWKRYLDVFNELSVVARARNLNNDDEIQKLSNSNREGVRFIPLESISSVKGLIFDRKKIKKELTEIINETDVIIARVPSMFGRLAISIAKDLGKPYAVEVVADAWDELWNYGNVKGKLFAPISYFSTRKSINNAPFAIYVTKNFLQTRYPNRGYSTNASNVELADTDERILNRRLEKIKKTNNEISLGLIGSLSSGYKGIDTAIKALSEIGDKINFKLHILGDGNPARWRKMAVKHGVSDRIIFDGTLPKNDVFQWLDKVDIYIHPSRQEGLPRAVIEAMSRGCPVIASTTAGIPELIKNEYLHKPKNHKKLSKLLELFTNNKNILSEQAKINFREANKYRSKLIEEKRYNFWSEFRKYSQGVIDERKLNGIGK
ncbi:glycosyltransferase family 4 protein [Halobacillus salinarum]|uniref:Glycosyltransferase family 4 protein n=1 Tax=Halobacillus salinarum TaxID=2932257 RepID=A0ABY4EW53_9BACI|nr:glycosyltransferase [Halobacillus salinarum]UOQ46391.1 glycosyltransferase family 4 protein [Halobacillus salinarum]